MNSNENVCADSTENNNDENNNDDDSDDSDVISAPASVDENDEL